MGEEQKGDSSDNIDDYMFELGDEQQQQQDDEKSKAEEEKSEEVDFQIEIESEEGSVTEVKAEFGLAGENASSVKANVSEPEKEDGSEDDDKKPAGPKTKITKVVTGRHKRRL